MSYMRVTAATDFTINDLGYSVVALSSPVMLSNQFSIEDLQNSADLSAAIAASNLTVEMLVSGVWTAVSNVNYNADDVYAAAANIFEIVNTVDNEKLVNGTDVSALHNHNGAYFTKTQVQATTDGAAGASLVGIDQTPAFTNFTPASGNVQSALEAIDTALGNSTATLDTAYTHDTDGILLVNGTTKPLNFKSNNSNDILVSRTNGTDTQDMLRAKVSTNEVILGAATVGGLGAVNAIVNGNLTINGNVVFTGSITDTTVSNLDVTNNTISMRVGAVTDANSALVVNRPVAGTNSELLWNETGSQWEAGLVGSTQKIALVGTSESITGIYDFIGGATTDPNMYLTSKSAAPSTNLGGAGIYPIALINGVLSVYDKSNSRNKFLSVAREHMVFVGRDSSTNTLEYARIATFTSNQAGNRLIANATLVGISAQTNGSSTWTVRVRKNSSATNLSSLTLTAVAGAQDATLNVDFSAGDNIEVYIDGTGVNRPVIKLEFAYKF
jgi:hypothetical protein